MTTQLTDAEQAVLTAARNLDAAITPPPAPPTLPVAEPGQTTSEFKLLRPYFALTGVAQGALALASAFGATLTAAQIAAVQGFVASVLGAYASYALSRGIRKSGTTQ